MKGPVGSWRARYPLLAALVLMLSLIVGSGMALEASAQTATSTPSTAQTINGSTTFPVADIVAKANPAVVTIYNLQNPNQGNGGLTLPGQSGNNPFPNGDNNNGSSDSSQLQRVAAGSGWIYDSAGHVITNAHVVEGEQGLQAQLSDGTVVDAKLIGTDVILDVAVLQLELKSGQKVPGVLSVGDSSKVRAGDQVVALGSPLGEFTNSVSEGIIGGINRSLDTGEGYDLQHLLQHDAPISPGNSGGPLLNLQGQVIGMNTAKVDNAGFGQPSASGLNFAIDSDTVKTIADQIIKTGKSIPVAYLGVATQEDQQGDTVIVQLDPSGPAADAGLQPGDVVTAVDGHQVTANEPLGNLIFDHKPGDSVRVTVDRNGSSQTVSVTLGTRPANS
jgi:S1-C subfamily serine protease